MARQIRSAANKHRSTTVRKGFIIIVITVGIIFRVLCFFRRIFEYVRSRLTKHRQRHHRRRHQRTRIHVYIYMYIFFYKINRTYANAYIELLSRRHMTKTMTVRYIILGTIIMRDGDAAHPRYCGSEGSAVLGLKGGETTTYNCHGWAAGRFAIIIVIIIASPLYRFGWKKTHAWPDDSLRFGRKKMFTAHKFVIAKLPAKINHTSRISFCRGNQQSIIRAIRA